MANKAKHAFGSEAKISEALAAGKIDAYDILFLDEKKVGWVNKDGEVVIAEPDLSGIESEIAAKADAEEVNARIDQAIIDTVASANEYTNKVVEAAMDEHLTKKYEFLNAPAGALVDYREDEIRILCPADSIWEKQNVGVGGDANTYYGTLRTYAPSDNAVGYIEHLGNQVDPEILTDLKTDEYGKKYQPTWLGLATYNESANAWNYYGKNSSKERYIGWDYQIDWYDANGVMIASDSIRINLSNEDCHSNIEPYYVGKMMKEVDDKIAAINSGFEIIEF